MSRIFWHFLITLSMLSLVACQSAGSSSGKNKRVSLSETLQSQDIISLPYKLYGRGIFVVDLRTKEGKAIPFLIDTGATQSAIFQASVSKLDLTPEKNESVKIHGMSQQGSRPIVSISELHMGFRTLRDFRFAVLKNRANEHTGISPYGLIGMDVLEDYRLYVDADSQTFNLIPKRLPAPHIPYAWQTVRLEPNPFTETDLGLHFMQVRLGNQLMPALLDTGAEDNFMNWNVSKFPQLRRARKRLYERWVVEGAVGAFEPEYVVKVKNMRSGQKFWDQSEFVVTDFDGLDILGVKEQAFVIAGSPLLANQTFYVDFAEDLMRFKPKLETRRARSLTSTSTVFKSKDVEQ